MKKNKKIILITGAAGMIGSELTNKFIKDKNNIIIGIDNFILGTKNNIKQFIKNDNFKFFKINLEKKIKNNRLNKFLVNKTRVLKTAYLVLPLVSGDTRVGEDGNPVAIGYNKISNIWFGITNSSFSFWW